MVPYLRGTPELVGDSSGILEAIEEPDLVISGLNEELIAIKKRNGKCLVVVYKEMDKKVGFVITAFLTSNLK